jgi:hypothetical protein
MSTVNRWAVCYVRTGMCIAVKCAGFVQLSSQEKGKAATTDLCSHEDQHDGNGVAQVEHNVLCRQRRGRTWVLRALLDTYLDSQRYGPGL